MSEPLESPSNRPAELALLLALLAVFAILALVTYSHLGEDAFISYRYARNFASGKGLVYNPGEYVEGYSNLLWVVVVAPFQWLGVRLHVAGRLLSTALFGLLIVAGWWSARRVGRPGFPAWVAWWLPVALALEPFLHYHDDRGLETVPYAALIGGAVLLTGAGAGSLWIAALSAAIVWTRPEGLLFPLALLPALYFRGREKSGIREALPVLVATVAAFLAQLAFRKLYYGEWLPNTVIAKRASGGGLSAVLQHICSHAFVPVIGFAGMIAGLRIERFRPLALAAAGVTVGAILFQMQAGNLLNEGFRYQAPLFVPVIVGCWLLVASLAEAMTLDRERGGAEIAVGAPALVLLALVPITLFSPGSRWFRGNTDAPRSRIHARVLEKATWDLPARLSWYFHDPVFINTEAGRWVAANLPPEAPIAGDQLGQFGFYVGPNRTVIDLLGLMDSHIARHGISMDYLRQRNPDYLVIESRTDERFWPREARLMPSVPSLAPLVTDSEFRTEYRPRWFLIAPLSFSKIGFLVYVRQEKDDGAPLEKIEIGPSEPEFEALWRVK